MLPPADCCLVVSTAVSVRKGAVVQRGFKNHILIPTVRTAKDPDSWQLLASRKSHLIETLKESQKNDNGTVVVHGAVFGKPDRVACCVLEANGEKHSDKCS